MLFRNIRIHNPPTDDISEWLPNFRISFYHRLKIALYHITIAMIVVSSDDDMGNTMQRTNLLAGAACWVQIASFDWRPKKKIKQQYTRISHNERLFAETTPTTEKWAINLFHFFRKFHMHNRMIVVMSPQAQWTLCLILSYMPFHLHYITAYSYYTSIYI